MRIQIVVEANFRVLKVVALCLYILIEEGWSGQLVIGKAKKGLCMP